MDFDRNYKEKNQLYVPVRSSEIYARTCEEEFINLI